MGVLPAYMFVYHMWVLGSKPRSFGRSFHMHYFFELRSLFEAGVHAFGQASWPMSFRNPTIALLHSSTEILDSYHHAQLLTWVLDLWTPACVAINLPAKPSLRLRVVSSWAVPRVAWVWHSNKIFAAVYASVLTNPVRKGSELIKSLRGLGTWLLLRIMKGENPDLTLRKLFMKQETMTNWK